MDNRDVATTTFTYLAVEDQIRNVWRDIKATRENFSENGPIRDWEILRLMEVHNQLDIESIRQQEVHLKSLIESLKLDQIHAKGTITGGLKARITGDESFFPKATLKTRSQSDQSISTMGFVDPLYDTNQSITAIKSQTSDILMDRKKEITRTLIILNHKQRLTREEEELKQSLLKELKTINSA